MTLVENGRRFVSIVVAVCLACALTPLPARVAWAHDVEEASEAKDALAAAVGTLHALDEQPERFTAEIGGVDVWFTVEGEGRVSVGRGNEAQATRYAVDPDFAGALALPDTVVHGSETYEVVAVQDYAFSSSAISASVLVVDAGDKAKTECALTSVTIPKTVVSIGAFAFYNCSAIAQLNLAADGVLETIGVNAFARCRALRELAVPASVQVIESQAFNYCNGLTTVTFAQGSQMRELGAAAFACSKANPGKIESFHFPAVRTIAASVLEWQEQLAELTFEGDAYESLGDYAFQYCTSLKSVYLPDFTSDGTSVTTSQMQRTAFGYCTSLETIVFTHDADAYVMYSNQHTFPTFYGCTAVKNVVYYGKPWGHLIIGGGMPSVNGTSLTPASPDAATFLRVDFYESKSDAEAGATPISHVCVRSDVTPSMLSDASYADDQLFTQDGGFIPGIDTTWAVVGFATDEPITTSTSAYIPGESDIASCRLVLQKTEFMLGVDPVQVAYSVTTAEGAELVEGTDFETEVLVETDAGYEAVNRDAIAETGSYIVRFKGIGAYEGSVDAGFIVVEAAVEDIVIEGDTFEQLARFVDVARYEDETASSVIVASKDDPRYLYAALAVSNILGAPVAFTGGDALEESAAVVVRRIQPSRVIVLGSTDVVSSNVTAAISAMSWSPAVSRIQGADVEVVAANLQRAFAGEGLGATGRAYVVASNDISLASTVASSAYRTRAPVFFASTDGTLGSAERLVLKTGGLTDVVVVTDEVVSADDILAAVKSQVGNRSVTYSVQRAVRDTVLKQQAEELIAASMGEIDIVVAPGDVQARADVAVASWYCASLGRPLMLVPDTDRDVYAFIEESIVPRAARYASVTFIAQSSHFSEEHRQAILDVWSPDEDRLPRLAAYAQQLVGDVEGADSSPYVASAWAEVTSALQQLRDMLAAQDAGYTDVLHAVNALNAALQAAGWYAGAEPSEDSQEDGVQDMYRLYNPYSGEHFYTSDAVERDDVVVAGWRDEGVGWHAPVGDGYDPVYRLYNPYAGEHHYTLDSAERDALVKAGWNDEGIGWKSADASGVPLYRQYNPNQFSCNHNYTADEEENDNLVALGWLPEGIGWYGVDASASA